MNDTESTLRSTLRFRPIDRQQPIAVVLDEVLPADHPARLVVAFTEGLDFTPLHQVIKARIDGPGAAPFEPALLFSLWLLATVEGIASARKLARSCRRDLAYRWICGGPGPSYHTLSTFYAEHGDFLDATFVDVLEMLTSRGLLTVEAIAVDGRKVVANASKESFHRAPTLERHRQEAEQRVALLREQRAAAAPSRRKQAAQERAARARQERLQAAVATVQQRQAERTATGRADAKPEDARASATDADARKMKRGHGGYEPAYNVQTATDVASGFIVAVAVTEQASDNGQLVSMVDQASANVGKRPHQVLADAGFMNLEEVEQLEKAQTQVYMPPKNERQELQAGKDPYAAKRRDKPAVAAWRQRMGTEAARALYRRRAPVAEGVHAQQSNRGWKRFRLRGLVKATAETLWQALAHNVCVLWATLARATGKIRPATV